MNVNKNSWIVAEHLSIQQKEMLLLRAQVAGFRINMWHNYDPRLHHRFSFIACHHSDYNGNMLIGTNDFPLKGHVHISYEKLMEKLRLIILNNNHLQKLKNESDN